MTFDCLNFLGAKRKPFVFICDFKAENLEISCFDKLEENDIEFCIDKNYVKKEHSYILEKKPVDFSLYRYKFNKVIQKIKAGETYLLNLTQPTHVKTPLSLKQIFKYTNAHYKLRYKDEFVCFSPEKFIQIQDDKIHTFPMKGTIDASIQNAKEKILSNEKEMAEHVMIVDLLRNDLSMVATDVNVEDFRYVDRLHAGQKELLQVSSHISANVGDDWHSRVGDILKTLLPAGSISGTPKKSTLEIIQDIEGYERGFFSGVFGVYDGKSLDSCVMIRFIEKTKDGYIYKSGGGITLDSDAKSEYEELLDKVYLP